MWLLFVVLMAVSEFETTAIDQKLSELDFSVAIFIGLHCINRIALKRPQLVKCRTLINFQFEIFKFDGLCKHPVQLTCCLYLQVHWWTLTRCLFTSFIPDVYALESNDWMGHSNKSPWLVSETTIKRFRSEGMWSHFDTETLLMDFIRSRMLSNSSSRIVLVECGLPTAKSARW